MWIAPDKAIHLAANSIARPMVPRYNRICGKDLRAIFPPLLITLLGLMTGPSPQKICMDTTCILIDNTPHLQDPGRPRIYGKRRFKYIYLPSYSPFWIQLSVLVKVLVRCREVWHRRQRKGQGNPQTLSPALIATPGKGILFERCFQEEGMSYVFEERAVYNVCVWRVCIGLNFAADNIMICTGQVLSYPCTATRHQTPKKSVSQAMASFSEERLNVQRNCSFNNSFYKIRLSRCSQTVPAIDAITSLALWGKRTRYLRGSVRTDRM